LRWKKTVKWILNKEVTRLLLAGPIWLKMMTIHGGGGGSSCGLGKEVSDSIKKKNYLTCWGKKST